MYCDFSPVAFKIFGFSVYWYSLAYIFGILSAFKMTKCLEKRSRVFSSKKIDNYLEDFLNYVIVGIILGGRVGHVLFYEYNYYIENYCEILKVWKGGMSFFGGFLGVVITTYIFCRKRKIKFLRFIDLWSVSAPIGLFLGRIANFINGELLGKESSVPWCVVFKDGITRHPSQLYEAFLEGILLFFIMIFSFYKKSYTKEGRLCGIFCCGYGCARILGEFFREPDSAFSYKLLYIFGLNLNQFLSIGIIILGATLINRNYKNNA